MNKNKTHPPPKKNNKSKIVTYKTNTNKYKNTEIKKHNSKPIKINIFIYIMENHNCKI